MANLTKLDHLVLEAIDNEALTLPAEKRLDGSFTAELNAYRNAAVYADQWRVSVEDFRQSLIKLYPGFALNARSRQNCPICGKQFILFLNEAIVHQVGKRKKHKIVTV